MTIADNDDLRSRAEQLALWALRRTVRPGPSPFGEHARRPHREWQDLDEIVERLRAANQALETERGYGLSIANPGHIGITADERSFLRAVAAAQAEAEARQVWELDAILPASRTRLLFGRCVSLLAATLAAHDHWLPQPNETPPLLSCAALDILRRHGADWRHARIMWP